MQGESDALVMPNKAQSLDVRNFLPWHNVQIIVPLALHAWQAKDYMFLKPKSAHSYFVKNTFPSHLGHLIRPVGLCLL